MVLCNLPLLVVAGWGTALFSPASALQKITASGGQRHGSKGHPLSSLDADLLAYSGSRDVVSMNTSADESLCVGGKLFPELYVLGGPKCATTSFGFDMLLSQVETACIPRIQSTECHFFDENWFFMRRPTCPHGARKVAGDFTPRNLRLVPLPQEVKVTRESRNQSLPTYLSQLHGPQAGRLTFVVLLREPLSLMQSLYYHSKSNYFMGPCRECRAKSFSAALEGALDKAQQTPPIYEDWLWMTMFGQQLDQWLQRFDARQFMVIPFTRYTADPVGVCNALSAHMQYPLSCDRAAKAGGETTHANGHAHPSLTEDTTPLLRAQFDTVMHQEQVTLIKVLRAARHAGATFMNFSIPEGKAGTAKENGEDAATIEEWLHAGWGGCSGHASSKLFSKSLISW